MKKITALFLSIGSLLISASSVHAAVINITVSPPANLKVTSLSTLISGGISAILVIAVVIAFVFLLWGGIQWITSGGDKAAVEAARSRILAAIIGLFVVFAAWALTFIVAQFFGMNIYNLEFQTGY